MAKTVKTNAMRILEKEKIPYRMHIYSSEGGIDGVSVAKKAGLPEERVFKTLVTRGRSGSFFVFAVPVARELNLKAAASAVGEKSVEMIAVKELEKTTGYIRGGCSPVGMKKKFVTVIDSSALGYETIFVSGGKIGFQIELAPSSLAAASGAKFEDIVL